MTKEKLKEILDAHRLWLDGNGGDRADLRDADLRGADLRGADLRDADLSFSSWPLWCGSIGVKLCDNNIKQLIYHAMVNMTKGQQKAFLEDPIDYANGFHMVGEVEEIVKK